MSRSTTAALLFAAIVMSAGAVRAQPAPVTPGDAAEEARQKATSAKQHFDRGEYAIAIEEYREAYRLMPSSGLLYNLGQAYRLSGACAEAAHAYREYLRLVPDSPHRATVEQNLAAADVCERDDAAAAAAAAVNPAGASGRPGGPAGSGLTVAASGTDPAPSDRGRGRRRGGVITAAGGGVLLAAGAYFVIDAASAEREVSDFYEHGGTWAEVADADERGRRSRTLARVTLGTGAVAIAAGATLYVLGRRVERPQPALTASVAAGGRGGEVVVSWRF